MSRGTGGSGEWGVIEEIEKKYYCAIQTLLAM